VTVNKSRPIFESLAYSVRLCYQLFYRISDIRLVLNVGAKGGMPTIELI
jgi:hypothetical protein